MLCVRYAVPLMVGKRLSCFLCHVFGDLGSGEGGCVWGAGAVVGVDDSANLTTLPVELAL